MDVLVAPPQALTFLPASSASMALSSALDRQNLTAQLAPQNSTTVHVAIGRSMEKGKALIFWAVRCFNCKEVVLVHVYKPSLTIPTMLGRIPAKKASEEVVSSYRREERREVRRTLQLYVVLCRKAQVKASILLMENEDIVAGLVHLINKNAIRRLVMGTSLDSCKKVQKGYRKASIAAKNCPPFCEIWFINKGKHIWTKDATEGLSSTSVASFLTETDTRSLSHENFGVQSDPCDSPEPSHAISSPTVDHIEGETNMVINCDKRQILVDESDDLLVSEDICNALEVFTISTNIPSSTFDAIQGASHEVNAKNEQNHIPQELPIKGRVEELATDVGASREPLNYKEFERERAEAVKKAKSFEASIRHGRKVRKELQKILKHVRGQKEELIQQSDAAAAKLAKSAQAIASLESACLEACQHQNEVAEDLRHVQTSIVSLKIQRHEILRLMEKSVTTFPVAKSEELADFSDEGFVEFSLLDLQNATCGFSESFKIGHGGYGCVYKGELMNKSVAIKKLYPQNIQMLLEFEQEAHQLGTLRHPHLVALIGVCPDAWSLVVEYIPNGNLNDRLFRRTNSTSEWAWQERTRTASEIASALLFLHSSEPNEIVHGDLKPENILFGSDFSCKVGDFGISRLILEGSLHCPSFRKSSESTGPFSYVDPEYQMSGKLTPKSDVYSFGIIVLQLLTGRHPAGLISEVRRAMFAGKLSSVLDSSAGGWPLSVATRFAEFGLQCCENNSRSRPDLTDAVVRELERLHIMEEQPVPHFFLCPILKEVMHDPHVAADGYTYEGKALRNWLECGHDTSPMTNLKLDDLNLTPNHTLRLAIQEWLYQSSPTSKRCGTGRTLT